MESISNNLLHTVQENQSFVLMLFVPIYAFMAKLVFFNIKKYNYTELLVVFMYIIAQLNIFGSIINVISACSGFKMGSISPFILVSQILYSAFCLKRLYNLNLKGILLRTLLFLVVLSIVYVASIFASIGIIYLIKGPEFFKDIIDSNRTISGS